MTDNKKKVVYIMIYVAVVIIIITIIALIWIKVRVNESGVDNEGGTADEYGDYPDYGELYANNVVQTNEVDEETQRKLEANYYEGKQVSDQQMAENYFTDFRDNRLYHIEEAYRSLEEGYRNSRFGSLEGYKAYIDKNRVAIATVSMKQYKVEENNGKKSYTCIDQNGNYYTFTEIAVMQYTVREGKYNPEPSNLASTYNSALEITKVQTDVNRFIMMLNNKQYDWAYKMLEENFKNTHFKTEEDFTNYVKENFFEDNNTYFKDTPTEQENGYLCKTILINNADQEGEQKEKTFTVQLSEGTDFTISFTVE